MGGHGFVKPWLWLWLSSFVVVFAAALTLAVSAGESIRGISYGAQALQAALIASALTGLVWVFWMFRTPDELGGRPVSLLVFGVFLVLFLFVSLFYGVENYRGKRAWLKCLKISAARGEKLTLAELAPPAVPDDENFAMQPIWVESITARLGPEKARIWYGARVEAFGGTNQARPLDLRYELPEVQSMTNDLNRIGGWQLAQLPDLGAWQRYYRQLAQHTNFFPSAPQPQSAAADVLLALSRSDDTIKALRRASQLPFARFPIAYKDKNSANIPLPHLAMLKKAVSFLQLRASAELQAEKTAAALDDIKLMLRLNDLVRDEPFVISQLVHLAMFQIEVQVIWQGLAERRWNDAQLAELDNRLAQTDFLQDYTRAMTVEMAFDCQVINYMEQNRRAAGSDFGFLFRLPWNLSENETLMKCLWMATPRGWFDQNKAAVWHVWDEYLDHVIDMAHRTYSITNADNAAAAADKLEKDYSPYNRIAAMLLPALSQSAEKFVFAQHDLDFARIAIALERYRLANGNFPDSLGALSPKFLAQIPSDLISGEPLRYRRTEAGNFILYAVGWNQTDDGGEASQTSRRRPNPKAGDWVWAYPRTEAGTK